MAGRGIADVVFCLDSSTSMQNTFSQVRAHIASFASGLQASGQTAWDVRYEFVSHSTSDYKDGLHFRARSVFEPNLFERLYQEGLQSSSPKFFTSDVDAFRKSLEALSAGGDETNLVALDLCLDLPWREAPECHRVVILLTDEPLETGLMIREQFDQVDALIQKIHSLGILLFIVGPQSEGYEALSMANRSVYEVVPKTKGLQNVDFAKVLSKIGKSVSASRLQRASIAVPRAIFGQDRFQPTAPRPHQGA